MKNEEFRTVVRVRTSAFATDRGLAVRRDMDVMKRLSGRQAAWLLSEEISAVGVENVAQRIVNLDEVGDGLYRLVTCNESKDWETGIVDDYDFMLVPWCGKISVSVGEDPDNLLALPKLGGTP